MSSLVRLLCIFFIQLFILGCYHNFSVVASKCTDKIDSVRVNFFTLYLIDNYNPEKKNKDVSNQFSHIFEQAGLLLGAHIPNIDFRFVKIFGQCDKFKRFNTPFLDIQKKAEELRTKSSESAQKKYSILTLIEKKDTNAIAKLLFTVLDEVELEIMSLQGPYKNPKDPYDYSQCYNELKIEKNKYSNFMTDIKKVIVLRGINRLETKEIAMLCGIGNEMLTPKRKELLTLTNKNLVDKAQSIPVYWAEAYNILRHADKIFSCVATSGGIGRYMTEDRMYRYIEDLHYMANVTGQYKKTLAERFPDIHKYIHEVKEYYYDANDTFEKAYMVRQCKYSPYFVDLYYKSMKEISQSINTFVRDSNDATWEKLMKQVKQHLSIFVAKN